MNPSRRSVALFIGLALSATHLHAQSGEDPVLRGKVLSPAGEGIGGAWIALAGHDRGTYSRSDGVFTLPQVPAGPSSYEVEALGYESTRVTLDPGDGIHVLEIAPDPVVLEGFEIVQDRFRSRRNSVATSVRVFDRERLAFSGSASLADFIRFRVPFAARRLADCLGGAGRFASSFGRGCASAIGSVCLDEAPFPGGWQALEHYQPHEFYMVEVYGRGAQVRLYTEAFMERAAKRRMRPLPFVTSFC